MTTRRSERRGRPSSAYEARQLWTWALHMYGVTLAIPPYAWCGKTAWGRMHNGRVDHCPIKWSSGVIARLDRASSHHRPGILDARSSRAMTTWCSTKYPMTAFTPLPIDAATPDLVAALARGMTAVLVAPPGAGKT